jgi:hypothetical protein
MAEFQTVKIGNKERDESFHDSKHLLTHKGTSSEHDRIMIVQKCSTRGETWCNGRSTGFSIHGSVLGN